MSAPAVPILAAWNRLVADYLGVLANERGVSAHTLRAYSRELHGFAAWVAEQYGSDQTLERIEHTHIRAFLGTLYDRGLQSLCRPGAGGHSRAGSSGWRAPAVWSRMSPLSLPLPSCPSICHPSTVH